MFGRVRAASCPAESLERPPSKILKEDPLSIYEVTLMKLKLGSKRNLSPCSSELGEIDGGSNPSSPDSEPMTIKENCASTGTSTSPESVASSSQEVAMALDTDCSSVISSTSSSDCNSVGTSKQKHTTNLSVLYLFSKYTKGQDAVSSSSGEAMTIDTVDTVGVSPSSSVCQSLSSTEQQLQQECMSSLPAATPCPHSYFLNSVCDTEI